MGALMVSAGSGNWKLCRYCLLNNIFFQAETDANIHHFEDRTGIFLTAEYRKGSAQLYRTELDLNFRYSSDRGVTWLKNLAMWRNSAHVDHSKYGENLELRYCGDFKHCV